jgi:hypothetical protein
VPLVDGFKPRKALQMNSNATLNRYQMVQRMDKLERKESETRQKSRKCEVVQVVCDKIMQGSVDISQFD